MLVSGVPRVCTSDVVAETVRRLDGYRLFNFDDAMHKERAGFVYSSCSWTIHINNNTTVEMVADRLVSVIRG